MFRFWINRLLILAALTVMARANDDRPRAPNTDTEARAVEFLMREVPAWSKENGCLKLIRAAQTSDGGWGPYADAPPEAFDTAVVLLALTRLRREPGVDDLIRRGRGFLTAQQNPDGSWPATTRPSGGASYDQLMSTTGWATLALLETR